MSCLLACVVASGVAHAVGEPVNGFPNWAERVIHEWINRARVDPQLEMDACGSPCVERACYSVMPPLTWNEALNRAARFHSDAMVRQNFFAHDSACTLVSNIGSLYPTSCDGSASCACVGGTKTCSPTCTSTWQRIERFGGTGSGEIIASPSNPNTAFYLWLFEQGDTQNCQFTSANGHRWLILKSTGAVGVGVAGRSTGDFGPGSAPAKIPSGAHYPQQAASVAVWANWYDAAGPSQASVNVDGTCTPMTLQRGTQTNGAWSATVTGAGSGCHRYYFSFRDAAGTTVTYPTTGSLAIGSGATCPDWDSSRPPACGAAGTPTSTPSHTPIPATATRTASQTSTATSTATPTASLTPTRTSTMTATASASPTLPPSGRDVSGTLRYYSNALPVLGMQVQATAATGATSAATDASGQYILTDVPTENLLVFPHGAGGISGAVSALDAAWVLQAVAGSRSLSSQQRLACDVTGNGSVSAFDATLLLRHAVGLIDTFPVTTACNSDWVFLPVPVPVPNQTLIQPQPGDAACTPGGITYQSLAASADEQNFSALVFGDCTGNWQPPNAGSAALAAQPLARAGRLRRLRGGRLALSIAVDRPDPVYGLDLRVTYDAAALRAVGARLVGAARHAALAFNLREAGVARIAVASGEVIPADGTAVVVVLFEAQRGHRVAAPFVSVRVNDE